MCYCALESLSGLERVLKLASTYQIGPPELGVWKLIWKFIMEIYREIYLETHLETRLEIRLATHAEIHLEMYLETHLEIYPYIHLDNQEHVLKLASI